MPDPQVLYIVTAVVVLALVAWVVVVLGRPETPLEAAGKPARGSAAGTDAEGALAWIDEGKQTVTIDYRPVHTYTMSNEVSYIEPKARVY